MLLFYALVTDFLNNRCEPSLLVSLFLAVFKHFTSPRISGYLILSRVKSQSPCLPFTQQNFLAIYLFFLPFVHDFIDQITTFHQLVILNAFQVISPLIKILGHSGGFPGG